MFCRSLLRPLQTHIQTSTLARCLHSTRVIRRENPLQNILESDPALTIQVQRVGDSGIELADGLVIPSACIFLEGKVFLWNVPGKGSAWEGWSKKEFELFEVVVPRPEILLLGTGKNVSLPPPSIRSYLNGIGVQLDIMDTWNACSTYNLLTEEGRRVAAALLPYSHTPWQRSATRPS